MAFDFEFSKVFLRRFLVIVIAIAMIFSQFAVIGYADDGPEVTAANSESASGDASSDGKIEYIGDSVNAIREDGSVFGMFSAQDGTTAYLKDGEVVIHYVPRITTSYAGFNWGTIDNGEYTDESAQPQIEVKPNEDGTYDFTLSKDYCGYAHPIALVRNNYSSTWTTSNQLYLAIPTEDKIPEYVPEDPSAQYSVNNVGHLIWADGLDVQSCRIELGEDGNGEPYYCEYTGADVNEIYLKYILNDFYYKEKVGYQNEYTFRIFAWDGNDTSLVDEDYVYSETPDQYDNNKATESITLLVDDRKEVNLLCNDLSYNEGTAEPEINISNDCVSVNSVQGADERICGHTRMLEIVGVKPGQAEVSFSSPNTGEVYASYNIEVKDPDGYPFTVSYTSHLDWKEYANNVQRCSVELTNDFTGSSIGQIYEGTETDEIYLKYILNEQYAAGNVGYRDNYTFHITVWDENDESQEYDYSFCEAPNQFDNNKDTKSISMTLDTVEYVNLLCNDLDIFNDEYPAVNISGYSVSVKNTQGVDEPSWGHSRTLEIKGCRAGKSTITFYNEVTSEVYGTFEVTVTDPDPVISNEYFSIDRFGQLTWNIDGVVRCGIYIDGNLTSHDLSEISGEDIYTINVKEIIDRLCARGDLNYDSSHELHIGARDKDNEYLFYLDVTYPYDNISSASGNASWSDASGNAGDVSGDASWSDTSGNAGDSSGNAGEFVVHSIDFSPSIIEIVEDTHGWNQSEEVWDNASQSYVWKDWYYYDLNDLINKEGNSILVNGTEEYQFKYGSDGEGFYNSRWEKLEIAWSSGDQETVHWVKGGTYSIPISCKEAVCYVDFKIIENPVISFSFEFAEQPKIYEEAEGQWYDKDLYDPNGMWVGTTRVFIYDLPSIYNEGDTLTVTTKDGTETYVYHQAYVTPDYTEDGFYDSQGNCAIKAYNDINTTHNQYENPWTRGNNNYFSVVYLNHTYDVQVSVLENPVQSIEFVPVQPFTIMEHTEGYIQQNEYYDDTAQEWKYDEFYYYYDPNIWWEGNVLKVYTTNGTVEEYVYKYNEQTRQNDFINSNGELLSQKYGELKVNSDQNHTHWTVGSNNHFSVSLLGKTYDLTVTITENPIKSIEFEPVEELYCYKNDYTINSWGVEYNFDYNQVYRDGSKFIINGTDEYSYCRYYNEDNRSYEYGFVNHEGKTISKYDITLYAYKSDSDYTLTIQYNGFEIKKPIKLIDSPVSSVIYNPIEPVTVYESDSDGRGDYYLPLSVGDELTVTLKDGSQKVYTYGYGKGKDENGYNVLTEGFYSNGEALDGSIQPLYRDDIDSWTAPGVYQKQFLYKGFEFSVEYNYQESNVKEIQFEYAYPLEYYKNLGGHWERDDQGNPDFYVYNVPSVNTEGSRLTVTYTNNERVEYTYYNDYFRDENGKILSGYIYTDSREYSQYKKHWEVGSNNYQEITYNGCSCLVRATVEDKGNVVSYEYIPAQEMNAYYMSGSDQYYIPYFYDGDVIDVTFDDGTTSRFTFKYHPRGLQTKNFVDENGKELPLMGWSESPAGAGEIGRGVCIGGLDNISQIFTLKDDYVKSVSVNMTHPINAKDYDYDIAYTEDGVEYISSCWYGRKGDPGCMTNYILFKTGDSITITDFDDNETVYTFQEDRYGFFDENGVELPHDFLRIWDNGNGSFGGNDPDNQDHYWSTAKDNEIYISYLGHQADKPIRVTIGEPAVSINGDYYTSVQDAINHMEPDDVISLEEDITEEINIPADKVITIDLNGYSIVSETEAEAINNTGTLIIKNSGASEETNEPQESSGMRFIKKLLGFRASVDTANPGTISALSPDDVAILNRGSVTVESGNITGALMNTGSSSTLTITGGTINGAVAASNPSGVTITGGTFKYDPSVYLDSDHMTVKDGDMYKVVDAVRVTVQSMDRESYAEVATVSGGGAYAEGSEVTVRANGVTGYDFIGWFVKDGEGFSGEVLSTNTTYTFTANANTELVAVYKVSAVNSKAELQVYGSEFRVNGGPVQMAYNYSQKFDRNTEIILTATGEDFLYWMNSSRKIVSKSDTYTFTLVRDTTVTAVYKRAAESTAYVEFVSDYDQIMQAQNYEAYSDIEMPAGPSKAGYAFVSWDMTAVEIRKAIGEGETYIRVKPVYEKLSGFFSLTMVYDDEAEEPQELAGYQSYTLEAREIAGRKFAYWQDDWGSKLSTSSTYRYRLNRDATIYAVYVDESETVTEEPLIAITNVEGIVDSGNKIQYTIIRDVPEGYTVISHGIVYGTNSMFGEEGGEDLLVPGAEKTKTGESSDTERYGIFSYNVNVGSSVNTTVYARGYLTVKNEDTGVTETVYSGIMSKTFNEVK